jgi:hypothetical protein
MRLASFAALAALAPAADGTNRGSLLRNGSPSPLTGVRQ